MVYFPVLYILGSKTKWMDRICMQYWSGLDWKLCVAASAASVLLSDDLTGYKPKSITDIFNSAGTLWNLFQVAIRVFFSLVLLV